MQDGATDKGLSPQIPQMRRKRRHRYPQMEERIGGHRCPPKTASVLSVVRKRRGGDLPQNTQNGLSADTEYTESIGNGGSAFSVFRVPPEAASVKDR